jgi:hypothetical protein
MLNILKMAIGIVENMLQVKLKKENKKVMINGNLL